MTDPIFNSKPPGPSSLQRSVAEKADRKGAVNLFQAKNETAAEPSKNARTAGRDEVILSNVARQAKEQPEIDRVKVESIKKAIQEGQYPLDPRRIAESFVDLEKLVRG